jgi:hypothetical protein
MANTKRTIGRKLWWLAAGALLIVGCLGWSQRMPVLRWYYLRELAAANEDTRTACVERAATLDTAIVPGALEHLQNRDPTICHNAESLLTCLIKAWGADDARTIWLADEFRERFDTFSPLGQIASLQVMTVVLRQDGARSWPAALTRNTGELVQACRDRPELRSAALVLASVLLERVPSGQWVDTCRALAEKGLSDRLDRSRLAAVQLLMQPALQGETALLAKLVPMLRDPKAAFRRAAVVALAPARDVVGEDELLPLLHDDDIEVQHLCEAALRSRGLDDKHLELARLISDQRPAARLKVLDRLARVGDLDPAAWLRRLTVDPSPAVRAAAVRATVLYPDVNLNDRLREMVQQDPSETVRQNAQYYLQQRQ